MPPSRAQTGAPKEQPVIGAPSLAHTLARKSESIASVRSSESIGRRTQTWQTLRLRPTNGPPLHQVRVRGQLKRDPILAWGMKCQVFLEPPAPRLRGSDRPNHGVTGVPRRHQSGRARRHQSGSPEVRGESGRVKAPLEDFAPSSYPRACSESQSMGAPGPLASGEAAQSSAVFRSVAITSRFRAANDLWW